MKERAYLTIYRRWMKKEKQKKNRPDGEVPCRSVFVSFFPVFTYLHQYNCTMYIWRFRNNLQPYIRIL